jgi:cytochrome c
MRYLMVMALAGLVSAPPALASMDLSDKYECTDCHRLDIKPGQVKKKKEGPAYKEIAKEYKGKANIEKQLADSIIKGSKGKWGKKSEMDAEDKIPPKDVDALVKWIMTL